MLVVNNPNAPNFQGYLKFKTSEGVKKMVDASKIMSVVSGSIAVYDVFTTDIMEMRKNGWHEACKEMYPDLYEMQLKEIVDGSKKYEPTLSRSTESHEEMYSLNINQLTYTDSKLAYPDDYKKAAIHYDKMQDIKLMDGADLILIDPNKLEKAFWEAKSKDELIDITSECGVLPKHGVGLPNHYNPLIKTDKLVLSAFEVANLYRNSAEGYAKIEDTIGAKGVLTGHQQYPIQKRIKITEDFLKEKQAEVTSKFKIKDLAKMIKKHVETSSAINPKEYEKFLPRYDW